VQVQIGSHSFTFDHVYGSTGTPSAAMFDECVAPLVDGLFQGYNATVLAYGQVRILLSIFFVDHHACPALGRSSPPSIIWLASHVPLMRPKELKSWTTELGPLTHGKSQQHMWSGAGPGMEHQLPASLFFFIQLFVTR